jgi:flagellar motor switch protein FliG
MQRRRVAGLSAVAAILAASDQRVGMRILDSLNAYDRRLAERLQPGHVEFDDFVDLDDRSLEVILAAADPEVAILALVGASPDLTDRLLGLLPEAEARVVRHKLVHIGPTRLSDVEQARGELVELARRLAAQGRVRLPRSAALA